MFKKYRLTFGQFLCSASWELYKLLVVVVLFPTEYNNGTIPGKGKHFVDIRKHIETLLHLSVVTREATRLIKLATKLFVMVVLCCGVVLAILYILWDYFTGTGEIIQLTQCQWSYI